jgi:hypothetical protein
MYIHTYVCVPVYAAHNITPKTVSLNSLCAYTCMCLYTHTQFELTHTHTHMHTHMHIKMRGAVACPHPQSHLSRRLYCMYVCMYVCMFLCRIPIYTHMDTVYVCCVVYVSTHTYAHTHTHTHQYA